MRATAHLLSFPVDFRISRTRIVYSHHVVVEVGSRDATARERGAGSGVVYRSPVWRIKQHWDRWLRAALEGLGAEARPEDWKPLLARVADVDPGLCFAVDAALWDLRGRRAGRSVADLLGGVRRERIPITEQLFAADPKRTARELRAIRARGTMHLKVKTGFGARSDLDLVERLRHAAGEDVEIRVDANRAYRMDECLGLYRELAARGVRAAEEPVAERSWDALRRFREETGLPVILDESILSLRDLEGAIQAGALDVLNLKLTRVGGLSPALDYIDRCRQSGIEVCIGCSEDIGPGMAAILQLSAAVEPLHSTEGMGALRLGTDIADPPVRVANGAAELPPGPGLGVTLRPDFAARLAARARVVDLTCARASGVFLYSRWVRWRQRTATAVHRLDRAAQQPV